MFFSKKASKQKGGCLDTLDTPWIRHWIVPHTMQAVSTSKQASQLRSSRRQMRWQLSQNMWLYLGLSCWNYVIFLRRQTYDSAFLLTAGYCVKKQVLDVIVSNDEWERSSPWNRRHGRDWWMSPLSTFNTRRPRWTNKLDRWLWMQQSLQLHSRI